MPPSSKRRRVDGGVRMKGPRPEELTFDFEQRQEYLSGFHKRKQARIKHAQEVAAKKEREERVRDRQELRQKRKADLEEHVKAVNAALKLGLPGEDQEDAGDSQDGSDEEWSGVSEDDDTEPRIAPAVQPVDHEDEYIDEDRFTTVTVEEVGISKHGFDTKEDSENGSGDENIKSGSAANAGRASNGSKSGRGMTRQEEREGRQKKKKRKKFKYESKADRKVTKAREKIRNSKAAKTRKGN